METCKVYYCYKATNRINGRGYIGFATNPQTRWRNHKRDAELGRGFVFHAAIRKYGWGAFEFEVLCCGKDKREMLGFVEPLLIEQHHTLVPQGYNVYRKAGRPKKSNGLTVKDVHTGPPKCYIDRQERYEILGGAPTQSLTVSSRATFVEQRQASHGRNSPQT